MSRSVKVGMTCIIILSCLVMPLFAVDSWKIGLYVVDTPALDSDYRQWLVDSVLKVLDADKQLTAVEYEYLLSETLDSSISDQKNSLHSKWQKEQSVVPALIEVKDISLEGTLPLEVLQLQGSPQFDAFLTQQGYDQVISLLARREGLMELVVLWPTVLDDLLRLRMLHIDMVEQERTMLLDVLIPLRELTTLADDILMALIGLTVSEDVAVLTLEGLVPNETIFVNGKELQIVDNSVLVPSGLLDIKFQAYGYETVSRTIDVEPASKTIVDASMVPTKFGPLSISSRTGNVQWFYDGIRQEGLPVLIDNQILPFSVVATKEGFMPSAVQSVKPLKSIEFNLRPAWMDDENLIIRNKESFYQSMGMTLGTFGLWVGLQALAATFSNVGVADPLWQPWVFLCGGAAIVCSVDLIGSLLEYYSGTRKSVP